LPLLKANIQEALRAAGLTKERSSAGTVEDQLEAAGLSNQEIFEEAAILMKAGTSDAVKLGAINSILKVKGLMKEASAPPPAITIVIQGTAAPSETGINPILLPRELNPKPREA
jgi:hypothetical protein